MPSLVPERAGWGWLEACTAAAVTAPWLVGVEGVLTDAAAGPWLAVCWEDAGIVLWLVAGRPGGSHRLGQPSSGVKPVLPLVRSLSLA